VHEQFGADEQRDGNKDECGRSPSQPYLETRDTSDHRDQAGDRDRDPSNWQRVRHHVIERTREATEAVTTYEVQETDGTIQMRA
jgi:hypothetical protein